MTETLFVRTRIHPGLETGSSKAESQELPTRLSRLRSLSRPVDRRAAKAKGLIIAPDLLLVDAFKRFAEFTIVRDP